jgi:hypothetical protein
MKGRSIIDSVFLATKSINWVVETNKPIVLLFIDFEKLIMEWNGGYGGIIDNFRL